MVALRFDGEVVCGGDRMLSGAPRGSTSGTKWIHGENRALGYAGALVTRQEIELAVTGGKLSLDDHPLGVSVGIREFLHAAGYEMLGDERFGFRFIADGEWILAGQDGVWRFNSDFSVCQPGAMKSINGREFWVAAVGSGEGLAVGTIVALLRAEYDIDAASAVREGLEVAALVDDGTGGPFDVFRPGVLEMGAP